MESSEEDQAIEGLGILATNEAKDIVATANCASTQSWNWSLWSEQDNLAGVGLLHAEEVEEGGKVVRLPPPFASLPVAPIATPGAPLAPTAATFPLAKRSDWNELLSDPSVKAKDEQNGTYVVCLPCSLHAVVAKVDVKVKMRHAFKVGSWKDHCKTSRHILNYRTFISKEHVGQTTLTGFFPSRKRAADCSVPHTSQRGAKFSSASGGNSSNVVTDVIDGDATLPQRHTCYGVMTDCRSKVMKPLLHCWESYGLPGKDYVLGYFGVDRSPQIYAKNCAGAANANQQQDDKFRCHPCQDVKQSRGRGIMQILKKKYDSVCHIESIISQPFLTDYDLVKLSGFVKNSNARLTEKGMILKRKVDALIRHDKHVRNLAEMHPDATFKSALRPRDNTAMGASTLITKFAHLYENHKGFKDELIVCLLEAVISKVEGHSNVALAPMAANFFTALHSTSAKGFDIVSANLWGPSKRAIQVRNAAGRNPEPFICFNETTVAIRLTEIIKQIGCQPAGLSFSISIDATKVPPVKQLSTAHSAIIGAVAPHHFIVIEDDMTQEVAQDFLVNHTAFKPAQEVKVAVLTFQKVPKGMCPTFVLCGQAQMTNEINDFNDKIVEGCIDFCKHNKLVKLVSCAVDGVSVDSSFVRSSIVSFLTGKADHVGQTDTNHNAKSLKYQIFIGGSCCASIGKFIFDQGLLTICGLPLELYRSGDFASDLLVLRLASLSTVEKLSTLTLSQDAGTVGIMCLGLYFMRLNLFAVNSKLLDAQSRIVFIWASMLWVTSIKGISMITKRNYVCACLPLVFIAMRNDISNLRYVTSEPSEHIFGMLRYEKREFTVSEMCELCEKLRTKLKAIYDGNLKHSRDPKKGYQATMNDFINATKDTTSGTCGPFVVANDDDCNTGLAIRMWKAAGSLPTLLRNVSEKMETLLNVLGVATEDKSPFFSEFHGSNINDEILKPFKAYMPSTGEVQEEEEEEEDSNEIVDRAEEHSILHKRIIEDLLSAMAETEGDLDLPAAQVHAQTYHHDSDESGSGSEEEKHEWTPLNGSIASVSGAAMAAFQSVLDLANVGHWEESASEVVVKAMSTMDLKKRDKGSTSIGQKAKSLVSRWFTKIELKELIATQLSKEIVPLHY